MLSPVTDFDDWFENRLVDHILQRTEPDIDDEKLNKLAEESRKNINLLASSPHILEELTSYESGYKTGYRKVIENEYKINNKTNC